LARGEITTRRSVVLALLFVGTCFGFTRPAFRLADPMTNVDLRVTPDAAFPILVMEQDKPRIEMLQKPAIMVAPPGASFLVPSGKESSTEDSLNAHDGRKDGKWVLRVDHRSAGEEDIELYWMHDGYRGGGYRATSRSATPRYRKLTGPGFGIVAGLVALGLNAVSWAGVVLMLRLYRNGMERANHGNRHPRLH